MKRSQDFSHGDVFGWGKFDPYWGINEVECLIRNTRWTIQGKFWFIHSPPLIMWIAVNQIVEQKSTKNRINGLKQSIHPSIYQNP